MYNVVTDNYKLSQIVQFIKDFVPDLKVKFVDSPLLNQHTYYVNCEKIENIGFAPVGDLKRSIKRTLGFFR